MRVAVVGASGSVGGAIVRELESRGHVVTQVKAPRFAPLARARLEEVLPSVDVGPEIRGVLRSVDVVVNAAGDPGATGGDEASFNAANALVPFAIGKALQDTDETRFIHVSSSTVQGRKRPLDSSLHYEAFSPYSSSKILGEELLLQLDLPNAIIYRPPAVHEESRSVTRMIARYARSPIRFVAAKTRSGSPQALLKNVAGAVAFLVELDADVPKVVHHPWEGLTPETILAALGGKIPIKFPTPVLGAVVALSEIIGKTVPWVAAQSRRAELLWFGQEQAPSWLTEAGFEPDTFGRAWVRLGQAVQGSESWQSAGNALTILILTSHDVMIYNSRKEVVLDLLRSGHEVHLAYPGGERVAFFETAGASYEEINYRRHGMDPIADLKLLLRYLRVMRRMRPDVVLTYTIKPNIYGGLAARALGIPVVSNVTGAGAAFASTSFLKQLVTLLYKPSLGHARIAFFQNESNLRSFQEAGIVRANARLLPGSGVNLSEFTVSPYPSSEDRVRLLFLGRIQADKGIQELCDAAKWAYENNVPVTFETAGFDDGETIEEFVDLVEAGVISHHGNVKDVRPLIANAHAVVLPSYHEGMANVLLEAAAMGRPILASDIPGCREIFDEGRTGLGFTPKDSQSLIDTVQAFMGIPQEKREKMGLAGRQKVETEFDRQIVVAAYTEAVERATQTKSRTARVSEER